MTGFQRFSPTNRVSAKWICKSVTHRTISVLICLLMLATAGVASAATYWVSPTGSDTNAGTQSEPWQTFAHAAATAIAGDTVVFQDGVYGNNGIVAPNYVVVLNNSGTASAPITFMAQHRGGAILDGGDQESATCAGPGSGAAGYLDFDNASNVVVQGFVIRNTCDLAIDDNANSQNITIRWNEIYDIGHGINPGTAYGIAGFYCGTKASGVILDGNSIHDVGRVPDNGKYYFNDHGIYINCPNVTIMNNILYNQDVGYDIQLAGQEIPGQEGAGNILIANNTLGPLDPNNLNPDHQYLYAPIIVWRGSPSGSISGLAIQNNIFYDPNQYAIYGEYPTVSNCQINTNLITNTAPVYYAVGTPGAGCIVGTNLLDTNAGMVDPANDNFDLLPWSPAIDAGATLGYVTTDFARTCRPQGAGYDIGAYEYVDPDSYNGCRGLGLNFPMSSRATNCCF